MPTSCSAAGSSARRTKNNGVLLLVAPNERRVRIEVGYGLEGTLTDALSKIIIANAITPRFKTGDFGGGITRGVDDIITVLTTDASEWQKRPSLRLDRQQDRGSGGLVPDRGAVRFFSCCSWSRRASAGSSSSADEHSRQLGQSRGSGGYSGGGYSAAATQAAALGRRGLFRRRRLVGRRRRVGELVMGISEQDRERISDAIRAAEARPRARSSACWRETSSDATALPILIAAVAALALPWLLVAFTAMTVYRILSLQVVVFVVLMVLLCLPRVRVALMPRRARRAVAHRVAMEQFMTRGIARTKDRSGILIFVSLAERYARIVADEGIAARVRQSEWQAAVDALIAHMRSGHIADGFVTAIDLCGAELAKHFPRTEADREELPDRIYVI